MIGQKILLNKIQQHIDSGVFPRFVILVGQRGSGKKVVAKTIATMLGAVELDGGIKADEVRDTIHEAYKLDTKTLCVFADTHKMSTIAQNIMLKVTEEPPNNTYFIMTIEDESQILPTLISRGTVYHMDNYDREELLEYLDTLSVGATNQNYIPKLLDLCETPYEISLVLKYGEKSFFDYIDLVVDNIAEVSGSNAFKIGQKLELSNDSDSDKFDLSVFWKGFINTCMLRLVDDPQHYSQGIKITSAHLQELRVVGVNKQMLFDMWLLDIRKAWMI